MMPKEIRVLMEKLNLKELKKNKKCSSKKLSKILKKIIFHSIKRKREFIKMIKIILSFTIFTLAWILTKITSILPIIIIHKSNYLFIY